MVPVLETLRGEIVQDTTDMIDLLEARHPEPLMTPQTPVQRFVALFMDGFGSEYLLPLAMHYRWSYRDQQEAFLCAEFGRGSYSGPDRNKQREAGAGMMSYFGGLLPGLGIFPDTIAALEASFAELMDVLDNHFQAWPYLLGGRPSLADFGMMAALFAHLGRDPVPASLMKTRAPNLYRWTERMNLAAIADGDFAGSSESYFEDDAIVPTLEAVLTTMFAHWGPGLAAEAAIYNAWIEANPSLPAGRVVSADGARRVHPTLGEIAYPWRGITMRRNSAPHALWLFSRALDHARSLDGAAKSRLGALVASVGGNDAMAITLARPMTRQNYALTVA